MVKKTKQDACSTRDAILQAATQVFFTQGVAKASLEEIARQANVTRGAVYWHFKNKTDIFSALHDELFMSCSEIILQGLETENETPLEQLQNLCVKLLLDLETDHNKRMILTIFFLKCDYSGEMEYFLKYQSEMRKKSLELFSLYFEKAVEKNYLAKNSDTLLLSHSLTCYITGIVFEYLRHPTIFDLNKNASKLIEQFFKGITTI